MYDDTDDDIDPDELPHPSKWDEIEEWLDRPVNPLDPFGADEMYPPEVLDPNDDDGTMPASLATLSDAIIGHKIVKVEMGDQTERGHVYEDTTTVITLDNGKQVILANTADCCAYTAVRNFLLHPDKIDHAILGVGTTGEYSTWHIYADYGDVLELEVGWSCGNPFYYGYGFSIQVIDPGV